MLSDFEKKEYCSLYEHILDNLNTFSFDGVYSNPSQRMESSYRMRELLKNEALDFIVLEDGSVGLTSID